MVLGPRPTAALAVEFNSMPLIASAIVAALAKTILRMAAPFNVDYDKARPSKQRTRRVAGRFPRVFYTLKRCSILSRLGFALATSEVWRRAYDDHLLNFFAGMRDKMEEWNTERPSISENAMQRLTVTTLTLMLLATMVVASLLSGIITMVAGLQEYPLMTLPAAQSADQPAVDDPVNAITHHSSAVK